MSKIAEVLQSLRDEEARLRVELSRVGRAIAAIEEAMGTEGQVVRVVRGALPVAPAVAPAAVQGPYASLSIGEAAAQYLASAGGPKTIREIADALRAGGFPTGSKGFAASVRTTLNRSGSFDGIEKVPNSHQWRFVGRNRGSD